MERSLFLPHRINVFIWYRFITFIKTGYPRVVYGDLG